MPYIDPTTRKRYERFFYRIEDAFAAATAGELAYILYRILLAWWHTHQSYTGINAILGALKTVEAEFYRREAAPYEDEKMLINGDVETGELTIRLPANGEGWHPGDPDYIGEER